MAFAKKKSSGRAWSPEEVLKFCDMWPDYSVRAIKEAFPDRSWKALRHKAWSLKLGARYQGFVSVRKAAKLTGYSTVWVRERIARGEIQAHKTGVGKKFTRLAIDIEQLEEFIKHRLKLETFESAGARHNMSGNHMSVIFRKLGKLPYVKGSKKITAPRLDPDEVDATVAEWKKRLEKQNAARAVMMKARRSEGSASPVGSTVSLSSKPKDNSSGRSSCSSATESTLGQAA